MIKSRSGTVAVTAVDGTVSYYCFKIENRTSTFNKTILIIVLCDTSNFYIYFCEYIYLL